MKNPRQKNEVMNERRERKNEWEERAALEQETDELGSGGEEEEKKKMHRQRDDRKEWMKGSGKELRKGRK